MNEYDYLEIVKKQIRFVFDRQQIIEELSWHLEDSRNDLIGEGLSEEEAKKQAILQMGDPVEVGKQLNKEHHPLLGYLWKMSQLVLVLISMYIIITVILEIEHSTLLLKPYELENTIEVIPVDLDIKLSAHHLYIDNICVSYSGEYYLTHRTFPNYLKYRVFSSDNIFRLQNSYGEDVENGGNSNFRLFGFYGYVNFDYPTDGLLRVVLSDGQILTIHLKEDINE